MAEIRGSGKVSSRVAYTTGKAIGTIVVGAFLGGFVKGAAGRVLRKKK